MSQYKTGFYPEILVYTITHIPHRPHTYILILYTTHTQVLDSSHSQQPPVLGRPRPVVTLPTSGLRLPMDPFTENV